ncbi:MAG: aldehyde dehydrogenase family protein [Bryobacteraceae bacterium]
MEYPMVVDGLAVAAGLRRAVTVPYDGSEFGTVFEATPEVVERAVASASRAAGIMREMTREERSAILRKAHARLLDDREGMAVTIASESGKPLKEARGEVDRAAWTLLFSSEEAHRLTGEVVPMDASPAGKGYLAMTVREPIGVIAAITPFNFPLNLPMHKIGPALAAGNAVVHKPASTTPICALRMARLFQECGLPPGALNVITGPGASIGEMLAMDPRVAMITFTGSAEVGLRLRSLAGMKKVTLELGNNSAVIIESDADLAQAVPRCVTGSFAHSGQVCISIQRIFVHQSLRSQFLDQFSSLTEKLVIGDPRAPETDVSSLITVGEAERVESWIQEAAQAGAHVVAGGERTRATVRPAVVTDVPDTARLSCEEAFGPVVCVNAYNILDEAIARVNLSPYGLQAGIYTRNLENAFRAARRVHVGGFLINEVPQFRVDQMPYGGVKLSGTGREGPKYAIEEMTEPKLIVWKV